jgi:uncharacterized membrane protein YiaA
LLLHRPRSHGVVADREVAPAHPEEDMETVLAVYAIVVGLLVAGLWMSSLVRGAVPELVTEPRAIRFHLGAEALMSVALVAGGVFTLTEAAIGHPLLAVACGMALYSIIASSSYFAERREMAPVVLFGLLFVLTALAAACAVGMLAGSW